MKQMREAKIAMPNMLLNVIIIINLVKKFVNTLKHGVSEEWMVNFLMLWVMVFT